MERYKQRKTYVTEVAGPISGLFVAHPKLHQNFQVLTLQDLFRALFINLFGLPVGQQRKDWGTIGWDKRDRNRLRIDRLRYLGSAGSSKDTAPTRVNGDSVVRVGY